LQITAAVARILILAAAERRFGIRLAFQSRAVLGTVRESVR